MIQGENVRLRAIERDDIPRFLRWMNDREVTQYLLINSPLSKAMEEKWFDRQVDIPIHQGQVLAIEVMAGDIWVHIGNTGLHDVDPVSRNAEFGIVIGEKEYWNRGFGRIATRLMLQHGFDDLNLHRIYLYAFATNPRGVRAYEAARFKHEGILRQAVYKNGTYLDLIAMSILQPEWVVTNKN